MFSYIRKGLHQRWSRNQPRVLKSKKKSSNSEWQSLSHIDRFTCEGLSTFELSSVFDFYFFPLDNVSLTWKRHQCRWRAATFDLWPLSSEGFLVSQTMTKGLTPIFRTRSERSTTTVVCQFFSQNSSSYQKLIKYL